MEGVHGRNNVGNNATEAKSKITSTGGLNVLLSQFIIGIISCRKKKVISFGDREGKENMQS